MLSKHFILLFLSFLSFIHLSCSENSFDPIPKGNGQFNEKYNHSNPDNLYFILENFRHGARSPCMRPLKDGKDSLGAPWPDVGGLTNLGRKQHFLLGKKNRERYNGFIKEKLDNNEIILYSTNVGRTKLSAQSHLLGFFNQDSYMNFTNLEKTQKKQHFLNLSKVIPPIHLLEKTKSLNGSFEYKKTFHDFFNCPAMHKNYLLNLKEKKLKVFNLLKKFNGEYYNIIKEEYNLTMTKTFMGLYDFCDTLISDYYDKENIRILDKFEKHGKKIELVAKYCEDVVSERFSGLSESGHAKDHGVATMSDTMKKMVNWMKNRTNVERNYINKDSPKYVLYSGHIENLIAMQRFLKNAFNIDFEVVPYASNQIFEVRKYGNEFNVEVYYNDRLKMNISFNLFEKRVNEVALSEEDIKGKCFGFENKNNSIYIDKRILLFGFIFLVLFSGYNFMKERYFKKIEEVGPTSTAIQIV